MENLPPPPAGKAPPALDPLAFAPGKPGLMQDTFSLDEGRAVLQWPEKMSQESFEDFESWLDLQLRKIARLSGAERKKN
jgi:hypothetical protein